MHFASRTHSCRDYQKVKRLTDMKAFFSRTGVEWPEMEWVNTDSIIRDKNLPEVPEGGMCFIFLTFRRARSSLCSQPAVLLAVHIGEYLGSEGRNDLVVRSDQQYGNHRVFP